MAKVRVYELAKELGVESRQVMAALRELGEFVRSASSVIEPSVERRVRAKLADTSEPRRVPASRPARPRLPAGSYLAPRPGRVTAGPRSRVRMVPVKDLAPLERLIAEDEDKGPRIPERDLPHLRAKARSWASMWFTDRDAVPWLALRMDPVQARECVDLGITPEMMRLPFRMPRRALCGGTLTYRAALARGLCTIPEIRDELVRTSHMQPVAGERTGSE